jgi:hypothetical protein
MVMRQAGTPVLAKITRDHVVARFAERSTS